MNKPIIQLTQRSIYGRDVYYPTCPFSELLTKVAGTKTLTEKTRKLLYEAGYTIEINVESKQGREV